MSTNTTQLLIILLSFLFIAVCLRLFPHAPNVTPIAALAFVTSRYFSHTGAIFLPLIALFISDLFIGFYSWPLMLSVYGAYAVIGYISWWNNRTSSPFRTTLLVSAGSIWFFLSTNAAVWMFSPWYEKSVTGLLYAYELGLPFLRNMLVGDLMYVGGAILLIESVCVCTRRLVMMRTKYAS